MLLDRLIQYLEKEAPGFSYIVDSPRMEIWVKEKEWFPIIVSEIHRQRLIISWGELKYEVKDEDRAYHYVLRICQCIKEDTQRHKN